MDGVGVSVIGVFLVLGFFIIVMDFVVGFGGVCVEMGVGVDGDDDFFYCLKVFVVFEGWDIEVLVMGGCVVGRENFEIYGLVFCRLSFVGLVFDGCVYDDVVIVGVWDCIFYEEDVFVGEDFYDGEVLYGVV